MQSISYDPEHPATSNDRRWFQNVKLIGELDKGTSLYIEDYAYTYLEQYAKSDCSCEHSAVLIGEHYKTSDQIIIYGIIPIPLSLIGSEEIWISKQILEAIEEEKQHYFPKGDYIGWMHTQPGYGIMITNQETGVHKEVFGETGILLLMDPIHDEKAFFTYEEDGLVQKKGFCLYYEKNDDMQRYMMDYPIIKEGDSEEVLEDDSAVANFRNLGVRRKREVLRKKKRQTVISTVILTTLLTGVFLISLYGQRKKITNLEKDVVTMHEQYSEMVYRLDDHPVEVVFSPPVTEQEPQNQETSQELPQESVEETREETKKPVQEVEIEEVAAKPVEEDKPKAKPQSEDGYDIHTVKTGESLLGISYRRYKTITMAKEIAELNKIEDHDTIYIGQQLKLPKVK